MAQAGTATAALKRSPDSTANLSRLIKSDLVAALSILERYPEQLEGRERGGVWSRILKAVNTVGKREAVVRMCGVMRKQWGSGRADDYSVKVLCRGLRDVGESTLADEVERDYGMTKLWP